MINFLLSNDALLIQKDWTQSPLVANGRNYIEQTMKAFICYGNNWKSKAGILKSTAS